MPAAPGSSTRRCARRCHTRGCRRRGTAGPRRRSSVTRCKTVTPASMSSGSNRRIRRLAQRARAPGLRVGRKLGALPEGIIESVSIILAKGCLPLGQSVANFLVLGQFHARGGDSIYPSLNSRKHIERKNQRLTAALTMVAVAATESGGLITVHNKTGEGIAHWQLSKETNAIWTIVADTGEPTGHVP